MTEESMERKGRRKCEGRVLLCGAPFTVDFQTAGGELNESCMDVWLTGRLV